MQRGASSVVALETKASLHQINEQLSGHRRILFHLSSFIEFIGSYDIYPGLVT